MKTRSNTRVFLINGEYKTVTELSADCGIKVCTINDRLRSGWHINDAIRIAPTGRVRKKTFGGGLSIEEGIEAWRGIMINKYGSNYVSKFRMQSYRDCGKSYRKSLDNRGITYQDFSMETPPGRRSGATF